MAQGRAQTTVAREISVPALAGVAALALGGWAITQRRLAAARRALANEHTDQITGLRHDAGHAVLAATAQRMRTALEGRLVPGRLGGDEFGLLLRRPQRSDLARLDLALRAPVTVPTKEDTTMDVPVSVFLGAVAVPSAGAHLGHLLTWADRRVYRAKIARRTARGRTHDSVDRLHHQTGELIPVPAPRTAAGWRVARTRHATPPPAVSCVG